MKALPKPPDDSHTLPVDPLRVVRLFAAPPWVRELGEHAALVRLSDQTLAVVERWERYPLRIIGRPRDTVAASAGDSE